MKHKNHFASGVRIANFSDINLPGNLSSPDCLDFSISDLNRMDNISIVKKIREYADFPFVFIVGKEWKNKVSSLLSNLKEMRSPCFPFALFKVEEIEFTFEDKNLDIIDLSHTDSDGLIDKIKNYVSTNFEFDRKELSIENSNILPEQVDVLIVGAGITGIYSANRLKQSNISFCVVDKRNKVGGIWSKYANETSRVNSSEASYRLIEKGSRTNRDHSATRELLEDITQSAQSISENLHLETKVKHIEKMNTGYRIELEHGGEKKTIHSKGLILAINDRVGEPRQIKFENQHLFKGQIVSGFSNFTKEIDWQGKNVVVVGMGAFAIENARTALEFGASHVSVVCRRHGTICPKIIDYLNFATPYDEKFKHDNKSNFKNMMYWKKLYDLSGATQPECWMGKIKHTGHTISVSDIWFIGHHLKKIQTIKGNITSLTPDGVVIENNQAQKADIIVNCVGFEQNGTHAKSLCDYKKVYTNNYVDKHFIYLADAYIDDDAFNSFFGSSVLEMVKFYLEVFVKNFDSDEYEKMVETGGFNQIAMEDRKWSHYISAAEYYINNDDFFYEVAKQQVSNRTHNFLEKHDLETYIAENKREWIDLHTMLAGKHLNEEERLPYVFEKLLPKSS